VIEEVSKQWRKWGVPEKDKKKIQDHIAAIRILKEISLKGSDIIRAYHMRRVAPLMAPSASLLGTTLAEEALPNSEITQRIKEAMEPHKTRRVPSLTSSTRCRGIPQCGRN
jgi:hypothetical protein